MWTLVLLFCFIGFYITIISYKYLSDRMNDVEKAWSQEKKEMEDTIEQYKRHIDAMKAGGP